MCCIVGSVDYSLREDAWELNRSWMFCDDLAATASAVGRPALLAGTVFHIESCITMSSRLS